MFQTTNQIIIIYIPSGYLYIYIHHLVIIYIYTNKFHDNFNIPTICLTCHGPSGHLNGEITRMAGTLSRFWSSPQTGRTLTTMIIYTIIYIYNYIYRWHTITILYKHYYRLKPCSKKYVTQLAYFILRPASQIDTTDTTDTRFFASWLPLQSAAWVCDDHLHLPWFQLESKPTDSEFHSGTNKLMFIVDTESYYLCKTHKEHSHSWIFRSVSPCGAAAFLNGSYGWSPCHGCPNFLRPARGVDACHLQM